MSANPWTDPDPKPGDFDADLAKLDPRYAARRLSATSNRPAAARRG
jgi:hypothetical protein